MTDDGVRLLEWELAAALGTAVAVTTRWGGVSEGPYDSLNLGLHVGDDPERVRINRTRAAEAFGVELDTMVFAAQVHGAVATLVGPAERGRGTLDETDAVPSTDILVTASPGTTLVMLVADCVPVALIDPEARVIAAVHAGWRGTAARAMAHALAEMRRHGARPERVSAYIGPAVPAANYQVDDVVRRGLSAGVSPQPLHPAVASPDGPGHWRVDLIQANRQQLVLAGVPAEQIWVSGASTGDSDFFSDRAARPCGRFGILIQLAA